MNMLLLQFINHFKTKALYDIDIIRNRHIKSYLLPTMIMVRWLHLLHENIVNKQPR